MTGSPKSPILWAREPSTGYDAYHPTEPWVKAVGDVGGIRTEYKYNANGQMIWAGDRYSTRVQVTYDAKE